MPITPPPADGVPAARPARDDSRLRVFRADIAMPDSLSAQKALAAASRQVSTSGAPVRLLYVRATYPPAEHPWVALFLAAGDDAITHVSEAARVPFAAVSRV